MKNYSYYLLMLLLGLAGIAQAQSLDDYLKEAAENNPGLKAKYANFEAAMQQAAQMGGLPDPTLSFGYFISPVETRVGAQRARFSLSQMFPWFGTLSARENMATLMAEAQYQEFLDARNELYYKVKAAWYPLYEVKRILHFQQENREILVTYKQLATTAFKNGKGSMADVIRVDIMLENTGTEIRLLEDKQKPLLVHFNRLLNRADTLEVDIPDSLSIPATYKQDSLFSAHPVLEAYDLKIRSAELQEKAARKQGAPKLGVGLDYVIVSKRTDMDMPDNGRDVFMPMVSMSLPIYRGKYRAAVKEAQFKQTAFTAARDDFGNNLRSKHEMTLYEMNKAKQLIKLYRRQQEQTQQVTSLLISAYSNSGKDFEEVLRMQQELLRYEIEEVKATKDYLTALAKLDYLTAKSE